MPQLLGIDIGSSSVKTSVLDAASGALVASASSPDTELPISSPHPGFAEQDPDLWWRHLSRCCSLLRANPAVQLAEVSAIGISYQMHGLVLVDAALEPLRPAIIWCDSRAVEIGARATQALGESFCLSHYRNTPGNFTASKLRWVLENEPDIARRVHAILLPGDYIAMKLTGIPTTTASGLSEGIFWDYSRSSIATELLDFYGISTSLLPEVVPTFGMQGRISTGAAEELKISPHAIVSYRAGDQPNNAFSLNVLDPGDIAATAGTSGVLYGVSSTGRADSRSRVNVFLHVNHHPSEPRFGTLLCINGTGILNSWLRRTLAGTDTNHSLTYAEMDRAAAAAPPGCSGLKMFPYGNGAERSLELRNLGASIAGLDFNNHRREHLFRAAQEGVVFALAFGMEGFADLQIPVRQIRAGNANMFRSAVFREIVANVINVPVTIYDTDGSQGAARGAGVGNGEYQSTADAFRGLRPILKISPEDSLTSRYAEAYAEWRTLLVRSLAEQG